MNKVAKEILQQCDALSLCDIDELYNELRKLWWKKYNAKYKRICIYPGADITEKIKIETGFNCHHESCGYSMGRGTHVIEIPIEQYTEELEKKLKDDYDY